MTGYIRLPRSALDIIGDKDLWQLYGYLLSKADENGQWVVSIKDLQGDLGLTRQRFRTLIEKLKSTAEITTESTAKSTTVTLNISTVKTKTSTAKSTAKPTAKFTPPTREEAQAYIDKMGFHWGDADTFIDWCASKGWKVGDQPMKDWKAAMRSWENKWKQKYGNGQIKHTTEDKYAARRGTDAGNHTEADYGGSF